MMYLVHHGILGQRWGIRRYQNADGSLTAAGRAHYQNQSNLKGKTVIKKGSEFYRVANSNEKNGEYRKYVTDNVDDFSNYLDNINEIDVQKDKSVSAYVYSAKKDLYVASPKDVCESMLKIYGDKKMSEIGMTRVHDETSEAKALLAEFESIIGDIPASEFIKRYDPDYDANADTEKSEQGVYNAIVGGIAEYSLNKDAKVLDDLYEQGYDVVSDLMDRGVMAKNPLILLNPGATTNLDMEIKYS